MTVIYLLYVYVAMDRTMIENSSFRTISPAEMERPHKIDLWFMSVKNDSWGHHSYAKQAILSAKNKTTLIPILILEGHNEKLEKWMNGQDVTVVHMENHELLEYILIGNLVSSKNAGMATWQRLVIPDVIKKIRFNQPSPIFEAMAISTNNTGKTKSTNGINNITNRNNNLQILHNSDAMPISCSSMKLSSTSATFQDTFLSQCREIAGVAIPNTPSRCTPTPGL